MCYGTLLDGEAEPKGTQVPLFNEYMKYREGG